MFFNKRSMRFAGSFCVFGKSPGLRSTSKNYFLREGQDCRKHYLNTPLSKEDGQMEKNLCLIHIPEESRVVLVLRGTPGAVIVPMGLLRRSGHLNGTGHKNGSDNASSDA